MSNPQMQKFLIRYLSSIIETCLQNSGTFGIGRNPYCGGHRTGYLGLVCGHMNEITSPY
jgi:hypothetical protein